jgi:hypothetical protein
VCLRLPATPFLHGRVGLGLLWPWLWLGPAFGRLLAPDSGFDGLLPVAFEFEACRFWPLFGRLFLHLRKSYQPLATVGMNKNLNLMWKSKNLIVAIA